MNTILQKRVDLFLRIGTFSGVAKEEGVNPATIRKQLQHINDPIVKILVAKRKHKKYKRCVMCERTINIFAKGQCQACYKYFKTSNHTRTRRIKK